MKIGIWCDYGRTLPLTEGIGVFVSNLVNGLLAQPEPPDILLLAHPDDPNVLEPLRRLNPNKVSIFPQPGGRGRWVPWLLRCWKRGKERVGKIGQALDELKRGLRRGLSSLYQRGRQGDPWALAACAAVGVVGFPLAWLGYAALQLGGALARTACFPLGCLEDLIRALRASSPGLPRHASLAQVHAHGCDVWVLPYLGLGQRIDFPSVLFVHDLVLYHHPQGFPGSVTRAVNQAAFARSSEATLCACMSGFIRDNDLLGVLGLPPERVRMIPPAPPADLPQLTDAEVSALLPPAVRRPFLFYPAALRGYKNHEALLLALAKLRDRYGDDSLDLVFTGPNLGLPDALEPLNRLRQLSETLGLEKRMHVLGAVGCPALAALYRRAVATVVPSLYEQGSFPVHESLQVGCPVLCSDIPPLREQCAGLGDAMLYFDPHDSGSLAARIRQVVGDREAIRQRQVRAQAALPVRTWVEVAAGWLEVFREAAEQGRRGAAPRCRAA